MQKSVLLGLMSTLGFAVLADALPSVPEPLFYGSINGKMSIWLKGGVSATNHWFQMKGADEDDAAWRTVEFGLRTEKGSTESAAYPSELMYRRTADFNGATCFRVANTNAAGEHAGWTTFGVITNFLRHVGTPIGTVGNNNHSAAFDGEVSTFYESDIEHWTKGPSPWIGQGFSSPVTVTRIRFAPRLSDLGWKRLTGDVFQCADDAAFTNPVTLGTVPEAKNITGVSEIVLDAPVTAQYFRILHLAVKDGYISIGELEFVADGIPQEPALSVTCSDDWTNQYAKISWELPGDIQCPSGIIERAVSPSGPFAAVSAWIEAGTSGSIQDKTAPVGVPYYYRLRYACAAPYLEHEYATEPLRYVRGKRLERDWSDLTKLKTGITTLDPYCYLPDVVSRSTGGAPALAFDGLVGALNSSTCDSFVEVTCYTNKAVDANRCFNAAVGVLLTGATHLTGVLAFPRNTTIIGTIGRSQHLALFGANAADLSDRVQLTDELGAFGTATPASPEWRYRVAYGTSASYTRAFLMSPTDFKTYGNVAEIGFFGYTDRDTIDSGVTVPPTTVTVSGTAGNASIAWNRAFNTDKLVVERRLAGGEWLAIAELDVDALAFVDYGAPADAALEYRVVAFADASTRICSPTAAVTLTPGETPTVGALSLVMDNWTNQAARLTWTLGLSTLFPSAALQRSVSPYGPFTDLVTWNVNAGERTYLDDSAAAGVPYYYRLKLNCEDPLAADREYVSAQVFFRRSRRLDRDWSDLTKLRSGVSLIYPFAYLNVPSVATQGSGANAFDGKIDTWCETSCYTNTPYSDAVRCRNPQVGVDLGAPCHITAALGINRQTPYATILQRFQCVAVFGADAADQTDSVQLTETASDAKLNEWYYWPIASADATYRVVFLREPTDNVHWFGNVAEVGFFGWCDQDIIDSGELIPPTTFTAVADERAVTLTWDAGWNVSTYVVQRRAAGVTEWTDVATLANTARSYADASFLRKGTYEYRVLAVSSSQARMPTAVVSVLFNQRHGLMLIIR